MRNKGKVKKSRSEEDDLDEAVRSKKNKLEKSEGIIEDHDSILNSGSESDVFQDAVNGNDVSDDSIGDIDYNLSDIIGEQEESSSDQTDTWASKGKSSKKFFEKFSNVSSLAVRDEEKRNFNNATILVDKDIDESEIDPLAFPRKISGKSFQSMCLSSGLLKAILKKGYRTPSPIQRVSIPVILSGKDVIGMARTGSGKTAAFVIPMIQLLKIHSIKVGVRALVISPTRELAIQTLKFIKQLSMFSDLRTCLVVGGDSLEDHFAAMTGNPDIVVATPGRLIHLVFEMNLKFDAIEYIVFDEADRLLELGFAVQMHELISRLPQKCQTLLFSATLPESLAEFAKVGLKDPALIRLDTDFSVSKDLECIFIGVKDDSRDACLLSIMELLSKDNLTLIFVPTKHHAEYVSSLLNMSNIESVCIYGDMLPILRNNKVSMFRSGKVKTLVVTDLAARGIDIPLLDNVINYTFPSSSKLFVHRSGRVARAGRKGASYSIVTTAEFPYLLDLNMFTGKPFVVCPRKHNVDFDYNFFSHMVYGYVNEDIINRKNESIDKLIGSCVELSSSLKTLNNAYKKYLKTTPRPSKESINRSKSIPVSEVGLHPLFKTSSSTDNSEYENKRLDLLSQISNFRPSSTIFEFTSSEKGMRDAANIVKKRRVELFSVIKKHNEIVKDNINTLHNNNTRSNSDRFQSNENDINPFKQSEISRNRNHLVEKALKITSVTPFLESSKNSLLNVPSDGDANKIGPMGARRRTWDSKRHKFKSHQAGADNKKLIKSESGALIPISFKSDRYEDWRKKTKALVQKVGDTEMESVSKKGLEKINTLSIKKKGLARYSNKNSTVSNNKSGNSNTPNDTHKHIQKIINEKVRKELSKRTTNIVSKHKHSKKYTKKGRHDSSNRNPKKGRFGSRPATPRTRAKRSKRS